MNQPLLYIVDRELRFVRHIAEFDLNLLPGDYRAVSRPEFFRGMNSVVVFVPRGNTAELHELDLIVRSRRDSVLTHVMADVKTYLEEAKLARSLGRECWTTPTSWPHLGLKL